MYPAGRDFAGSRYDAFLAAFLAVWVVWTLVQPQSMERWPGIDYVQFWTVGRARQQEGVTGIYGAGDRRVLADFASRAAASSGSRRLTIAANYRQRFETFSTPFSYQVLHWFTVGDYDRDLDTFQWASLASAGLAVLFLCRMAGYGWTATILVFLCLALGSEPLRSDMRVANVNRLQLGAIAAYLWAQRRSDSRARQLLAGALLGLLVLFKPTLAPAYPVLVLVWAATGQWRTLGLQTAGLALGASTGIAASAVHWGSLGVWREWARALGRLGQDADITVARFNCAAAQVLAERGITGASPILAAALLAITAGVLWAARRRAWRARPADLDLLGLVAGSLAFAIAIWPLQLVWLHYYVLFVPLALHVLRLADRSTRVGGRRGPLAWAVAVLVVVAALGTPSEVPYLRTSPSLQVASHVIGSLLLIGIGWVDLFRACGPAPGRTGAPDGGYPPG